jgi:branched-chain amino acid transport system substrate-binding protein
MTTLGKYELHEPLGRGGFGTVYRAIDTSLGREVALKVLHPQLTTEPDFLEKFRNEARLVATLDSPNIVTIYDLDVADGRVFIAMKYLSGGSLKQKLEKEGDISFVQTLEIMNQVCNGLKVAHKKGMVHRDIKPDNILFDGEGMAVIGDFGLARAIQATSASTSSSTGGVGTPAYRAPELWRGKPPASAATDIYSLGCILFEMLTGKILFKGNTPDEIITQHLVDGPDFKGDFPPGTPNGILGVIEKAISKNPQDRFQSVTEFEKVINAQNEAQDQHRKQIPAIEMKEKNPEKLHKELPKIPITFSIDREDNSSLPSNMSSGQKRNSKDAIKQNQIGVWIGVGGVFFITAILILLITQQKIGANLTNKSTQSNLLAVATATQTINTPTICSTDKFGCAVFTKGQVIKIGMGAPMTGGNGSYGIDISQGASIAILDGRDIQGWKFALETLEDEGTAEGGVAVANKFVADPAVVAVAGHIFSGSSYAAMPIYEKAGIPMMSPSAGLSALTASGSDVFNRLAYTDSMEGIASADFLYFTLQIRNLAILHDGTDYGKGLADIVAAQFGKDGGTVVIQEAITPGETDYTAILSIVASKNPEALYFGGFTTEGAVIVNQMKSVGLDKALFLGDDGTFGANFLTLTGKNGEGSYAATIPVSPSSESKTKFNATFLSQFGKEAGTSSPYTWAGYDAASILIASIKKVAVAQDGKLYIPRGALIAEVRNLKDYVGLSGTFTCQSNGECNLGKTQFVVDRKGVWSFVN